MTMQRTPLLMSRLLDRGAWIAPEAEIVTLTSDGTHRQTYADTRRRAGQLANGLRDLGIAFGDRVASFMWNGSRHLELYHAVPSIGSVLHTLNVRLGADDLKYIVNHAADRIIFADADLLPILERIAPDLPGVEHFIVCGEPGAAAPWETSLPNAIDYEKFIGGFGPDVEWPEFDENAPLGLCYTSGTTGNPKGVMYTHRSTYLHTMAEAMTDTMSLSAADCVCGVVPMFHAMGWGTPVRRHHARRQAGDATPVHGPRAAAPPHRLRRGHHLRRSTHHLAGSAGAARSGPGRLRPHRPRPARLRRLLPAPSPSYAGTGTSTGSR